MPSPTAPLSLPQELGTPIPPQGWLVDRILPTPPPEQMETDKVCLGSATGSRDVPRVSWSKRWISIASIQPHNPASVRNVNFCNGLLTFAPCHPRGSSLQRVLFARNTLYGEKKKWPSLHNYFRNSALYFNRGQTPWLKSGGLSRLRSKSRGLEIRTSEVQSAQHTEPILCSLKCIKLKTESRFDNSPRRFQIKVTKSQC